MIASLPAATAAFVDEPATRDFWYYAMFVTDECGNTSTAASMTDGNLNYHLGDVIDLTATNLNSNFKNGSFFFSPVVRQIDKVPSS